MSIFGEPLPHEDDTAASLIRREGFPPIGSYDQMPQVYTCACCSAISPTQCRDHLLRTAKEEREMERRKLMQLDVFDERAKPISHTVPRPHGSAIHHDPEDDQLNQPTVPPPPSTIDELRKMRREQNNTRLIVTIHHGKGINVDPRDPVSVLVRCGPFEGQTAKVPRGKGVLCTWEELFEFPYPKEDAPLEVFVVDDTISASQDHVFGGIVVPPYALRNRARGDEETLPVCPEDEMHRNYGRVKETPMGCILVSWYVKHDGQDTDDGADLRSNLDGPVNCVFVVHHVFQYSDNGAKPFGGGVLCVVRDTDDNCSDSQLYMASGEGAMSTSPYYTKNGYNYMPESPEQILQFITSKKLGHVLVCVPKGGEKNEEEDLLVVGAVPLDFGRLYRRGSAVLLVESKVKEDVLWGEISLEWQIVPHAELQQALEESRQVMANPSESNANRVGGTGPRESLYVTVVRGLNLTDRNGTPLVQAQVSVFAGDMEGSTFVAPNKAEYDSTTHLATWNQEVRFIEVSGGQRAVDLQVLEDKRVVSRGRFELEGNGGNVIVKVHDPYEEEIQQGEIIVSYNRLSAVEEKGSPTASDKISRYSSRNQSRSHSPTKDKTGYSNKEKQRGKNSGSPLRSDSSGRRNRSNGSAAGDESPPYKSNNKGGVSRSPGKKSNEEMYSGDDKSPSRKSNGGMYSGDDKSPSRKSNEQNRAGDDKSPSRKSNGEMYSGDDKSPSRMSN